MGLYYKDDLVELWHGDCLDVLRELPDCSVDSVVTDPPYSISFMSKTWDAHETPKAFQSWCESWAAECLRVLKPGGHLAAFGGTRTFHRLACGVEDAGFEIRDNLAWLYGSGFSKGGLMGNKPGVSWCECRGNALPLDHANHADLPRVRADVHASPVPCGESEDALLFPPVQRHGEGQGVGQARTQGARGVVARDGSASVRVDEGREESSVEGRVVHRAGQGLQDGADARSPAGASERLRGRAPVGDGVFDWASGDAARGSAPPERRQGGQQSGESEVVPGSHESLDDGALRNGPVCSRCGGLDQAFRGFSTTLKPAHEPIILARKPFTSTVAANVLAHGTGGLNVDACRVGTELLPAQTAGQATMGTFERGVMVTPERLGRWPANVILDESQADALDQQSGVTGPSFIAKPCESDGMSSGYSGGLGGRRGPRGHNDSGGASRFFYCPKAGKAERPRVDGVAHATVKPLALMRWLVRLITPPGGTVLEPFAGSGTTVEACMAEGVGCVVIEREAEYLPLIEARITRQRETAQVEADSVLF